MYNTQFTYFVMDNNGIILYECFNINHVREYKFMTEHKYKKDRILKLHRREY